MGTRRTAVVLAAVATGVLAGLAVYQYLDTVQQRANKGAQLVDVFVVKRDIAKGTPGERAVEEGWIQPAQINVKFRPLTAVRNVSEIRGKLAVTDLAANQVVVERLFVDADVGLVTSAGRIPTQQVAITLSFDDVRSVAGLIQPSDRVNMLLLLGNEERYLLQNVLVLFVGRTPLPQPGEAPPQQRSEADEQSGLITFAVSHENAAKIAYANARFENSIHLTLVPSDNKPQDVPAIHEGNLITSPTQTG
jgi:pilus assembly protein CpaB